MKKSIFTTTLLGLGLVMSLSAHAVIVDFAAIADGDNSFGVAGGERGAPSFTFTKNGISVTASGFQTSSPTTPYNAYLDAGNAGLGVCQTLNGGNQCNPSSDDNVTYDESLKLVFNQEVTINQTTFLNGKHQTNFNGDFTLSIDGGPVTTIALTNIFNTPLLGTTFIFSNPNVGGGSGVSNTEQFYIRNLDVAPVPIPGAVWLFGTGLIGLARYRRNKA